MSDEIDNHFFHLGTLVADFQTFEFVLRAFLQNLPGASPIGIPSGVSLYSFPVGTALASSEMTNYDTLSELIAKYNREMVLRSQPTIDTTLVEIRDALAHGRVSAEHNVKILRLLKFSKANKNTGQVTVTFNEEMKPEWFKKQITRVLDAVDAVNAQFVPPVITRWE